jgi:NAD-dependent SIR2 family protein deacetylase
MSISLGNFGSAFNSLRNTLTGAGVSATSLPGVITSITGLFNTNPNKADEIAVCTALIQFAGNPTMVAAEAMKLATEVGIPPAAAALAQTLTAPGANVPAIVLEIEQIINNG